MTDHPAWFELAKAELDVSEITDPRTVIGYFRDAGFPSITDPRRVPWCAGFACAILERDGVKSPRSLWARDFLKWGQKVQTPYTGCVVVFTRGDGGHVAFFVKYSDDGKWVLVLGGNQSDKVCYDWYPVTRILGFREPLPPKAMPETCDPKLSPLKPQPITVYGPAETRADVTQRLRENASRIVTRSDASEVKAKLMGGVGTFGFVSSLMAMFTEVYDKVSPLLPFVGMSILGLLAFGLAVYMMRDQRAIRDARVDDDMSGLHLGRKDEFGSTEAAVRHSSRMDEVAGDVGRALAGDEMARAG